MSRLLFKKAKIFDRTGNTETEKGTIDNITVEGIEVGMTPDTVMIENDRELFESFTGRVVIRTLETNFDGTTDDILAAGTSNSTGADYIGIGGEQPKEGFIKLIGKGVDVTLGGNDATSGLPLLTFIQGFRSFENGRLETVIVAQLQDVDSRKVLFSEAGTA